MLGSGGMLGQMVSRHFGARHAVVEFNERYSNARRKSFIDAVLALAPDVVINCIGLIKQKSDDAAELYAVNAVLPFDLARALAPETLLVHPSTDCVFDGLASAPYANDDPPDAGDDYGWSKALGECAVTSRRSGGCVVRVSIIGPDRRPSGKGLLAWFLSQADGSSVPGFADHFWNGITTLEWCKQVDQLIVSPLARGVKSFPRLLQLGTRREYSKLEMLGLFNAAFGRDVRIEHRAHGVRQYRCLRPDFESPDLDQQLAEIRVHV